MYEIHVTGWKTKISAQNLPRPGLHLLAACYAGHAFFETSKKEGKKAPLFLCICHARASEHFTFAKQIFHREAISLALVKGQISLALPAAPLAPPSCHPEGA
jgi:hypothetical protein